MKEPNDLKEIKVGDPVKKFVQVVPSEASPFGERKEQEGDFKVTDVNQKVAHPFYWEFTLESVLTKESFVVYGHMIKE